MNLRFLTRSLIVLSLHSFAATSLFAQGYSIAWYKIAGGGGTSTGGGFILNGTIGQHDGSGQLSGGQYKLAGGFWPGIGLVQTTGAPMLTIVNTGTNAVQVCWPDPSTGWVLQQNASLNTTNWVNATNLITSDGDNRCITLKPALNRLFFRLNKP